MNRKEEINKLKEKVDKLQQMVDYNSSILRQLLCSLHHTNIIDIGKYKIDVLTSYKNYFMPITAKYDISGIKKWNEDNRMLMNLLLDKMGYKLKTIPTSNEKLILVKKRKVKK